VLIPAFATPLHTLYICHSCTDEISTDVFKNAKRGRERCGMSFLAAGVKGSPVLHGVCYSKGYMCILGAHAITESQKKRERNKYRTTQFVMYFDEDL